MITKPIRRSSVSMVNGETQMKTTVKRHYTKRYNKGKKYRKLTMSEVGKAVKLGPLCMVSNDVNGMSLGEQPGSLLKN